MAINIGVGSIAHKSTKAYIGINGIARKVSKAYIGVNNIAQLFFLKEAESILTHSTPTALSVARYNLGATSIGNYALFGGGNASPSYYATVDAYNSSLTHSTPTALSVARGVLPQRP
jgi:hypothetical protein